MRQSKLLSWLKRYARPFLVTPERQGWKLIRHLRRSPESNNQSIPTNQHACMRRTRRGDGEDGVTVAIACSRVRPLLAASDNEETRRGNEGEKITLLRKSYLVWIRTNQTLMPLFEQWVALPEVIGVCHDSGWFGSTNTCRDWRM